MPRTESPPPVPRSTVPRSVGHPAPRPPRGIAGRMVFEVFDADALKLNIFGQSRSEYTTARELLERETHDNEFFGDLMSLEYKVVRDGPGYYPSALDGSLGAECCIVCGRKLRKEEWWNKPTICPDGHSQDPDVIGQMISVQERRSVL